MIINIRGSSGSGKSTVIRKLMSEYGTVAQYGMLGPKRPEAYQLRDLHDIDDTFILGPYLSNCGGCDAIGSMDKLLKLLYKYNARGHVIFEGLIISSMYGSIGEALEPFGRNALIAFLSTSEARCRAQLVKRQESGRAKGDKSFERHYFGTQKVKARMRADGILRVEDLDPDRAVEQVTKWLTTS